MSEQRKTEVKMEGKLKRNLTLFEATVYSVAFVIGTGIFLKPSSVLMNAGSTGTAIVLWILGGLISMCSALTIAETAAYIPKLGGMYTYLNEIWGERVGFIYGWVQMLIGAPAGASASAIAFATFASYFVAFTETQLKILSIAMVIFFAGIQMISTKATMKLLAVGTVGKLVPIFAIIMYGLFKGEIPGAVNFALVGNSPAIGYGAALLGVLWSFDGWDTTCHLGSEMIEPEKNLPRAIIISMSFITVVYVLFNVVIFKTLSPNEIISGEGGSVGVQAAQKLFGNVGATLVSVGMLISSATTLNSQIINSSRITLSVATKKRVIGANFLGHVNVKYDTPINALIFVIVIISIYILSGTFTTVTNLVTFVVWIFFVLVVLGVFKLRKKFEKDDSLYSVPLFPIVPLIGAAGGSFLVISTFFGAPTTAFTGIGVGIMGIPMYLYCKKKYSN